jgi:hypothetical protein
MILIRRQAFPAALSASLNFGDSVPSLPRTIEACIAPSACCSYSRFNSWPSLVLTTLRVMILHRRFPLIGGMWVGDPKKSCGCSLAPGRSRLG